MSKSYIIDRLASAIREESCNSYSYVVLNEALDFITKETVEQKKLKKQFTRLLELKHLTISCYIDSEFIPEGKIVVFSGGGDDVLYLLNDYVQGDALVSLENKEGYKHATPITTKSGSELHKLELEDVFS